MAVATRSSAPRGPFKLKPKSESHTGLWITLGSTAALLIGLGGWWWWRGDPNMNRALALRGELEQMREAGAERDQMRAKYEELRGVAENLTSEQRRELRGPNQFEERMNKELTEYFKLPLEERNAAMDKRIDEMEKMRKEWEKRRQERSNSGNANNDRGNRGGGPGGGGGGPGGRGGGGREPRQQMTRAQRTRERLNDSTAEQRGQRAEYFNDMMERRKARGLPPITWGGRGRG